MRLLQRYLRERRHILIYGEAATGKTHLAYTFYIMAREAGLRPAFIATEPGTRVFLEHHKLDEFDNALTMDSLVESATRRATEGRILVVDSINWHYRENPDRQRARMLSYLSALMSQAGGVSTAQVSGPGEPSGGIYILPWAHVVAETRRLGEGRFELRIIKPVRRVAIFRPGPKGVVEWL